MIKTYIIIVPTIAKKNMISIKDGYLIAQTLYQIKVCKVYFFAYIYR